MAVTTVVASRLCSIWCVTLASIVALDNGVARRPPMGWTSWVRFGCNIFCKTDRDECISEYMFKTMADIMVEGGFRDAGYDIVAVDDCWMSRQRDADGRLQADPDRFPSGMKHLADYMHSRGLKLGLYACIGSLTCAGYPGSQGYFEIDADTFAEWGVDMIKFDGCHANTTDYDIGFPAMGTYLNRTGRPIIYSCEWPMYARYYGGKVDYAIISDTCNVFRALTDIYDSYYSVTAMIDYFAYDAYNMSRYARPGAWNDPDQLVIGSYGLSFEQERLQMAVWSMWSAPLIVSTDLRQIGARSKSVLLNRNVIAVNQDDLGIQARVVWQNGWMSAWAKPLLRPTPGSAAILFINRLSTGGPRFVNITILAMLTSRGFPNVPQAMATAFPSPTNVSAYHVTELFDSQYLGRFKPTAALQVNVNPSGVYLIRVVPVGDCGPSSACG